MDKNKGGDDFGKKNYSKKLQRTIINDLLNLNPYITQRTLLQSQQGK